MIKFSRFLGRKFRPLPKVFLPFMKNVLMLLITSVLIPVGLTASTPADDVDINKKIRLGNSETNNIE